jgi:hypothetical protein
MSDVQNSEVDTNLAGSTWEHSSLHADSPSKDELLLIRPCFVKKQKYEYDGRLKV